MAEGSVNLVTLLLVLLSGVPGSAQTPANTRSPHGNLNLPCQNCHTFSGWKPIRNIPEFDHNQTRYPLRGMHQKVTCTECHTKPVFTNVGTKCADCHADIHKRQFGANCEQCHTVKGWQVSIQQIQQHQNRFPLIGAHAALDCDSCHKSAAAGQFQGLSTQCYSCHARDFQRTTGPSHASAGFPTGCDQCHNLDNWFGVKFDHLKYTGFALTGMHATLDCMACHIGGKFKGTTADCVGCHLNDFRKTTNPNHVASNFPQTCQTCHSTSAWQPASFDHNSVGFPLTGGHAGLQCTQCHVNGNYNLTSNACSTCHMKDYNSTNNPNHVQAKFPTNCQSCHNTTSWGNATFNHTGTGFALTGAHATLPCTQCHVNGNYNLTSGACSTCHMKDYNGATDPNHVQAGFPTTCDSCHSTASWAGAKFDHNGTGFALTGAHATLQCSQCHINGNYKLNSGACVTCHLKDFNNTKNPNHVQAGFPQTCDMCHNTTAWIPSSFNHDNTPFPLTGAHKTVPCASCHVNNNYTNIPTDCYSCHKTDYQNTNNPNHIAAGFPTTCQTCHTTTSWDGAKFDHTYFPMNHGGASGCNNCHTNPSDYSVFSCTICHAKSKTDQQHQGVRNYVYNSPNCYQCHPKGQGG
ncbi:MAG: hypothetical protein LAO09_16250 [Acidobacteriia bacterium]|nr:hypothetical protein [Terriglobia bacterium]